MKKYVLGVDIGITSVGYGIIDLETGAFVDYGVRLFKEGTAAENETRRATRGRRRLTRRRKTRLSDMRKLLRNNHILNENYQPISNVYELRCKGLHQKLTFDELSAVILHFTKHRGSILETVEDDAEKNKDAESLKATLQKNEQLVKQGNYICEIQLDRLHSQNKIKGHSNNFSTKDYVNELTEILKHQELSDDLNEQIINIVKRRRAYYEGPGSEKSPTPYGRFIEVDGQIQQIDLIEKMRGKCSIYPDQLRAPKLSVSAELFNLLNDLNNLSVSGEKLTVDEKTMLLKLANEKGNLTLKQIAKSLETEETEIKGYRIDKNDKPLFTELKGYKKIRNIFKKEGVSVSLKDYELIDFIVEILTNKKGIEERKQALLESHFNITEALADALANTTGVSGYHSLSFKALRLLNTELFESTLNQMQLLYELKLFGANKKSYKGKKNIEADIDAILSPVAKRAQNEAFKVINALRKKYGEFDSIIVETTRDKNSDEQKKRIKKYQSQNEASSKEMDEMLKESGYDPDKINGKTRMKIRLYQQQHGKSAYTNQPLELHQVIKDPSYTEIDHIIPLSVSLDDSQNNKVLTLRSENQAKGNLTPFMAFQANKFKYSYAEFKANVLANKNILYKKRLNLLNEENITKEEVAKKFINRNLNDTSYACRVVFNTLADYFKDNDIDTKVHTVNGRLTDLFRKKINLLKDRDEDYLHHAVDALIVASIKKLNLLNGYLSKYSFDNLYNETTGEIFTVANDDKFFDERYIRYIIDLKTMYFQSNQYYNHLIERKDMIYPPIKISHKINTKPNRQIANETIYSTRSVDGVDYLVEKIADIYDPKEKKCKTLIEDILNHNEQKYLMAQHDPQTFDLIKQVVEYHYAQFHEDTKMYKTEIKERKSGNVKKKIKLIGNNPLTSYRDEHGPIRKYSKKGNGPEIISIKYQSKRLGNHIDISANYRVDSKKVILKQISPYRTDFYHCSDGKFRFVTVRYINVMYQKDTQKYVISKEWYEKEKQKKGIKASDTFLFSLHRDELIGIIHRREKPYFYDLSTEKGGEKILSDGIHPEILKFTATSDDKAGVIEINPLYTYYKEQLGKKISNSINLKKYATDVLGNLYEVKENSLKLEFD